nr:uncharacterized protein LOC128698880 [Cherax quadricarinatus]
MKALVAASFLFCLLLVGQESVVGQRDKSENQEERGNVKAKRITGNFDGEFKISVRNRSVDGGTRFSKKNGIVKQVKHNRKSHVKSGKKRDRQHGYKIRRALKRHTANNKRSHDKYLDGRSRVKNLHGRSRVKNLDGRSRDKNLHGHRRVKNLDRRSRVKNLDRVSRVKKLDRHSRVKSLDGRSRVKNLDGHGRIRKGKERNEKTSKTHGILKKKGMRRRDSQVQKKEKVNGVKKKSTTRKKRISAVGRRQKSAAGGKHKSVTGKKHISAGRRKHKSAVRRKHKSTARKKHKSAVGNKHKSMREKNKS